MTDDGIPGHYPDMTAELSLDLPVSTGGAPPAAAAVAPFDALYSEQFPFVWRMLRGFGVRDASLDDAVQDVFIAAHRRLPQFRGESSLRTWICAIAYRVALNYRRAQRRKGGLVELDAEHLGGGEDPSHALENRRRLQHVGAFLDELDDGKRWVFLLTFVEGMTAKEIAEALEIPMNTVYSRLHHARTAFRSFLERQGGQS
jgi:RNA polymerase sigma-70 factor, ECF subfamily